MSQAIFAKHPRVDLRTTLARQFCQPVPIENVAPLGVEDRLAAFAVLDHVQRLASTK